MLKGCVFIEKSNPFPCRQRTLFEKSLAKTFVKGNEQNQKKIADFLTSYLVERRLFVKIKARHFLYLTFFVYGYAEMKQPLYGLFVFKSCDGRYEHSAKLNAGFLKKCKIFI